MPSKIILAVMLFAFAAPCSLEAQPGRGPGGVGGPPGMGPDQEILAEYDSDKDGMLNAAERKLAREWLKENQPANTRRRRPGGRRGPGGREPREPGKPGVHVEPADVTNYPDATLYDPTVLRTLFLQFDSEDWEQELADFKSTDVEVPAVLTVDGKTYPNVGVSFRGASSYFMVPAGLKRSLNLSMDLADKKQRLYGYKSLNLLNGNGDASMMSSALYSTISRKKIAAPKVNFVKVVINGENWGIYSSSQQFNKVFVEENFPVDKETKSKGKKSKGKSARWKVTGSPRGDGGLRYLGEDIEPYRERFEIKSKDSDESWRALINLCRVLNETPAAALEEALEPILDIDGALWFLATDIALINSDGYWTRASDYSIYLDPDGVFHILPHDMNEAFKGSRGRGGPGGRRGRPGGPPPESADGPPPERGDGPPPERRGRGGPGGGPQSGGGVELDPLVGLDDQSKPLRSRLLAIDSMRTRYLENIREIAILLQWENIGSQVESMRNLIEEDISIDTRKLMSNEAFLTATDSSETQSTDERNMNLRSFAEKRAAYLLNLPAIKELK